MVKKIVFCAALCAVLCAAGAYARGSGEISRFTYQENGIGKNVAAEYIGVYDKRMYVSGSGRNARMVIDGAFCPWNGQYGEWEQLINMSYPNASAQSLLDEASGIEEVSVTDTDKKRYILELIIAQGQNNYFWWEGGELHFLQKVYQVK